MTTLTEFLLARIAEDEQQAHDCWDDDEQDPPLYGSWLHWGLAECEAKRRIVERHADCGTGHGYCDDGGHGWGGPLPLGCADLADLALPHADHPDYDEAWRP